MTLITYLCFTQGEGSSMFILNIWFHSIEGLQCFTFSRAAGNCGPCYTLDTPWGFPDTFHRISLENKIRWYCPPGMDPRSLFCSFHSPCTHTRNWLHLHLLCRPFLRYDLQPLWDLHVDRPPLRSLSTLFCSRHTPQGCPCNGLRSCWGSRCPVELKCRWKSASHSVFLSSVFLLSFCLCTFELPALAGPVY